MVQYVRPIDALAAEMVDRLDVKNAEIATLRARLETVEAAITKANDRLPGIETPMMRGDNLAICLCSFFDDGDKETEDDAGWSESARNGYEEVVAAIREHYASAIRNPEPRHD